jgi:uncharacterized DUF497 family protein
VQDDRFEWSDAKARANLRKHQVSFEVAKLVFDDPRNVDQIDHRDDYGEDRFNTIGMARGRLLSVTYTEREGRVRIISARKATRHEQDDYFSQDL